MLHVCMCVLIPYDNSHLGWKTKAPLILSTLIGNPHNLLLEDGELLPQDHLSSTLHGTRTTLCYHPDLLLLLVNNIYSICVVMIDGRSVPRILLCETFVY